MLALRPSIAWRPSLSIGIMPAPALPNSCTAREAFCAPSGMLRNLSATSNITSSAPLSLPCASTALMPSVLSADAAGPCPVAAASAMPFESLIMADPTLSMSVPDWLATCWNLLKFSTLAPVFWLKSRMLSAASMADFANATRPATLRPAPSATRPPVRLPTTFLSPPKAPSTPLAAVSSPLIWPDTA